MQVSMKSMLRKFTMILNEKQNGFAARLNARIAEKAQPQKQSLGGGTKLTDLSTNKTPDAEEDEKAQQVLRRNVRRQNAQGKRQNKQ